jgi:antitoxin HicB
MLRYPVVLEPDDNDTILVSFPDVPEAHTFGEDEADALARATDALVTALEARIKDRDRIPAPSPISEGMQGVSVPALVELKAHLYTTMREQRVGKAALARRLNVHMPQIDRLLDLRHQSRLDLLEAAFATLGRQVGLFIIEQEQLEHGSVREAIIEQLAKEPSPSRATKPLVKTAGTRR